MFNSTILDKTSYWILALIRAFSPLFPARLLTARRLISFFFFSAWPASFSVSLFFRPEWRNLHTQHVSPLVASILPRLLHVVVARDREFYETLKSEKRNLSCDTDNGVQFASRVVAALARCLPRTIFTAVRFLFASPVTAGCKCSHSPKVTYMRGVSLHGYSSKRKFQQVIFYNRRKYIIDYINCD